ncbi:hypothetical protein [Pseudorhodoferax sp. Leaf274]|uniref:hypothetical protein n=1 Tax=Pseudorhodoferax sp. Leaf274 TaxID=1736318 RepID=UPI0007030334|nr:hypothetical protein [Pseudorhodoferax sp. Leaf274]KQP43159.1 hypothetical protein ASF44_06210 [Pseudorhodoferax sp. Leaf274]
MPEETSPIAQWCREAREILGHRKTARASLVSSEDSGEPPDDDTPELLRKLGGFSSFATQVASFQERHADLVRQFRLAQPGSQKSRLGAALQELNQAVRAALDEAPKRNAAARWPGEVEGARTRKPRDGLHHVDRILREIKSFRGGDDQAWESQLDVFAQQADAMRLAVIEGAKAFKRQALAQCVAVRTEASGGKLAGGKLATTIRGLRERMAALKDECQACGLDVSDIEATVDVDVLERLYEAGFPQRTEGATPREVKATEGKAPELVDGQGTLDFLNSERVGKNWFTLKKLFKAGEVDEAQMKQAWALRQKIVDDYMANPVTETYKLVKGKTWMAPGSTNLESDIDVTILDHHWSGGKDDEQRKILKTDAAIVKEFNDWFLAKYGAQPGIMFDVNLYASAKPRRPLPPVDKQSPVEKAMTSMTNAGQDVGALMKMRRFMDWEEFMDYQETVLEQMREAGASDTDIDTTRAQFEEADGKFQLSIRSGLDKLVALLEPKSDRTDEQTKALKIVHTALEQCKTLSEVEGQQLILQTSREIEHMQDVAMWVNNELYTQGIAEVRQLELEVDALKKKIEEGGLGPGSPEATEMAGKVTRLKTLSTDTVFYANEAYHSEGPFAHIVDATQAVKGSLEAQLGSPPSPQQIAEETNRRLEALSVHLCLQSFNEQAGDMLKDLGHYLDEPNPGIGFYRASKYLVRLMDALALLIRKGVKVEGLDPDHIAQQVKSTLLAARKGEIKFEGITDTTAEEREIQAYAIEQMQRILGVRTLGALGAWVKKTSAQVNALARKEIAKEMRAAKELETAYFTA